MPSEFDEQRVGWEPKIASLETALAGLTRDLGTLTTSIQGVSADLASYAKGTSEHLRLLGIDVAAAAAPRRADWQVVVAASILVLALSAAVIAPLSLRITDTQASLVRFDREFTEHERQTLHPVGLALMARVEADVKQLRDEGSPVMQQRLAVLEEKLHDVSQRMAQPR